MKIFLLGVSFVLASCSIYAQQNNDSVLISQIYKEALNSDRAYRVLEKLCKETPHRLAGSVGSSKAVQMMYKELLSIADTVYLQEVTVQPWSRGKKEEVSIINGTGKRSIPALALGGSIGTGKSALKSEIIEVQGLEELKVLGKEKIKGKVVFYNQKMDPLDMSPGRQYGKTVGQRFFGAQQAALYGAKAVIVRSLSNSLSRYPHTGIMRYEDSIPKIPAITISTIEAENLSNELKTNPNIEVSIRTWSENLPDVKSYNVIAEIKGTKLPGEIITVGGHLDSWDVGEGAHDDGAGCVHSMEVLRLIKLLGIKTNRTIRVVLFMDEEMNQTGAKKYAQTVKDKNEKIYAAIESDSGGTLPTGFACTASVTQYAKFQKLKPLFEPYGITTFRTGGGGVDIEFLEEMHVPLLHMVPDPQRYFEYHHSENDTFEKISLRELQLGSASIASMVIMLDLKNSF